MGLVQQAVAATRRGVLGGYLVQFGLAGDRRRRGHELPNFFALGVRRAGLAR